jgi:dolichol-phosphate mannosyltransferase
MQLFKTDIPSLISKPYLLMLGLLTTCVDVTTFNFLSHQAHSLAFTHIASFLTAASLGYVTLTTCFKPTRPLSYVLIALLTVLLRGGLLASLMQISNVPTWAAIIICAAFSSGMIYLAYVYICHADNLTTEIKCNYFCLGAVVYIILLKLFYLGVPELIFEEAYYWNYAQHLDIGYLDHPLMIAWIIKLFTSLLGTNEFAVRFGAFLCWFVTAFYIYKITREILNILSAYWALLLVSVLPAYFSFGWFMSPDAPLTACWAAVIYYFHQVIVKNNKKAWLGVGISLGLGMISKYTIALLGGAIVLFLLIDRPSRKWLARPEPYIALLVACILFSPVIIWNIQHAWASFAFQSEGRVASGHHFSLPRFISNVLIFITPIGVMSFIAVVKYKNIILARLQSNISVASNLSRSYFLLAWLTFFPVFVFASLSLFRASKLNWTGPCWLALIPFLALLITQKTEANAPRLLAWSQRAWPTTVVTLMLTYGAGLHYLSLGLPLTKYPQNVHLMGWRDFGSDIETLITQLEHETGEKILLVAMDRNKIASGLAFYRSKYIEKSNIKTEHKPAFETASESLFGGASLMYEFWFPANEQSGKTMLLVSEKMDDLNSERVLSRTKPIDGIKMLVTQKNGMQTGTYYYRLVEKYQGKSTLKNQAEDSSND